MKNYSKHFQLAYLFSANFGNPRVYLCFTNMFAMGGMAVLFICNRFIVEIKTI